MVEHLLAGAVLPVPEPWRRLLAEVRSGLGDPLGSLVPPHVTVLPATRIRPAELPGLVRHARAVAATRGPITIALDGNGITVFPDTDVVYAPLAEGAEDCAALAAALGAGPVRPEAAHPYTAHLTLAQHQGMEALARARAVLGGFSARFALPHLVVATSTGSLAEWSTAARIAFPAARSGRAAEAEPVEGTFQSQEPTEARAA
ncbi:2'-5' RNA ligase family protein [Glycomyces sp. MUSA5-2]|uniref:2'-5' RNA ligase family protein n=1 Tax=Glycomyces sp. MUSA5-2 TaxID=2053002 RepID=UPI0030093FDB